MKSALWLTAAMVVVTGCASTPSAMSADDAPPTRKLKEETRESASAINHYLTSVMHLRRGDFDEAIDNLREAADSDKSSTTLQLRLLAFYYREGDFENSATMAERALRAEPNSVMLHIWLGRIYSQMDQYDKSTTMFEKAIELDPESTNAYEALAEIEEESNDLVGAVRVYEQMIARTPESAFLHYRMGVNLMEMNDAEGARKSLERSIELDPKMAPARYVLGVVYMDMEEWDKAEQTFVAFLQDTPDHTPSLENLASIQAHKGRYDRAYGLLTGLIESADVNVRHHIQRGYIYLRDPSVDSKYIASAPNDSPLLGTVLQMLIRRAKGEPNDSIARTLDTVDGDLDFECSVFLGGLLSRYGTDEAGAFLASRIEELVANGHGSRVLYTVLGRSYLYAEQPEKALAAFDKVLELFGSDKWIHYYRATTYESLDDAKNAEVELRKTLEFDPNDPDVLNFLGYLLADEDLRLKEAEELIERALLDDPDNGFYLDSLGWVYFRQGKGKEAVEYIKRAIRSMNSDDAILRDHLGDAYQLDGQTEKALAEWERARRLDPELEGVQEKIEKHQGKRKRRVS